MMVPTLMIRNAMIGWAVLQSLAPAAPAQTTAQTHFERGFFLQAHEADPAGAALAYETVVDDANAPNKLRAEARTRLAECREDLVATDFARLMPPDVIAYAEISNPGGHFARLVEQMGLLPDATAGGNSAKPEAMPLHDGFYLPHDLHLSPALIKSLKSFRGAAVAVTSVDGQGIPDGLLVLHPGETELLRGAVETAIQFCEPAEAIEGYRTYRVQGQAWATVTTRMILVSRTREQLVAAVERLRNPGSAKSLAGSDGFESLRGDREGALLYAYVSGPRAAQELRKRLQGFEAQMAAGFFDIDHLKSVSVAARATEDGISFQARLDLMEGHQNLAYGMIRTAPCSRTSLGFVPSGVSGVALLGLNPPSSRASTSETPSATEGVSAMDIGREIFANLEEAAVFVAPVGKSAAGPERMPIPDVGLVLIARNPAKSEALWSQLLSLPAKFAPQMGASAGETTVEGVAAHEYRFPQAPPVVLARVQDRAVVIGTRGAVTAAIQAGSSQDSIVNDPGFKPIVSRLSPSTSKAIMVHVGRALETAASMAPDREAEKFKVVASMLTDLRVCVVTEEKPTQFSVRAEATGLPNVPETIRKIVQFMPAPRHMEPQVQHAAEPARQPAALATP